MMDAVIRIGFFIGAFAVMAWWETRSPRRQLSESRQARWIANLGLVAIDAVAVRLVLAAGVTGFAANIEGKGYGLFGALDWPRWIEVILCTIALDLIIYLQHAAFHFLPALWRLHVVHHTDLDFDLTTAVRFHPIEIILSAGVKLLAVLALPRKRPHPRPHRPPAKTFRGDPRHAPGPSLGHHRRDELKFRIQPAVVGPHLRDLCGPAGKRSRTDADRDRPIPKTGRARFLVAAGISFYREHTPEINRIATYVARAQWLACVEMI